MLTEIMALNIVINILLLLSVVVTINARVRHYPFHPMILTRPKSTTTPAPPRTTTSTTKATTTTPEPPEQEQEEVRTTWPSSSNNFLTRALTTAFFGTTGEGEEWEEEMTTPSFWNSPTRSYNTMPPTTTTPRPTTTETTEEPPENENEGQGQGQGQTYSSEPRRGICFCSPFPYCPRGSIQRGGYCWDLSWYSDHPYIRCCYRPSAVRNFYRFVEKRK